MKLALTILILLILSSSVFALSLDIGTIYYPRQGNYWYDGFGIQVRHKMVKVGIFSIAYKYLEGELITFPSDQNLQSKPVYWEKASLLTGDLRILKIKNWEFWSGIRSIDFSHKNKKVLSIGWQIGYRVNNRLFLSLRGNKRLLGLGISFSL